IAHPTGIETHIDDLLLHLGQTAAVAVVQQKTPPSTRCVLTQVTLGAAVRFPAFDDLLAFAVGTSDRDEGHEPLLVFGGRQEEAQCAINLSPSPLLEHYPRMLLPPPLQCLASDGCQRDVHVGSPAPMPLPGRVGLQSRLAATLERGAPGKTLEVRGLNTAIAT